MNGFPKKVRIGIKAARQLGVRSVLLYAWYQLQLRSGILRWRTPAKDRWPASAQGFSLALPAVPIPDRGELAAVYGTAADALMREADEICAGRVRLFGGEPQDLRLDPGGTLQHWSRHTASQHAGEDIKFVWEPGRFGWAAMLAQAYLLTARDDYPRAFWTYLEVFLEANPPNRGPHWASGQEVGLRLMALVLAAGVFKESAESTPKRMALLADVLAAHAMRIPPTLVYARAQNNNHLLSEAAALYTAAVVLPEHPQARRWRQLGWHWLHAGLDSQISAEGAYIQHSTNYHRLMLQAALWANLVARAQGEEFPQGSRRKLALATQHLLGLLDAQHGQVPNLGSNDGAYILPLTVRPFSDFRPVLQAAGRAFHGQDPLPAGPWDDMAAWLAPQPGAGVEVAGGAVLRLSEAHSWAYLRAARFTSRPGHADQLHLDLWWRGYNLALDGGSYQYNADPPWRNGLDLSSLHNTLTVDGLEQMAKVGQFLWLDWAQAEVLEEHRNPAGDVDRAAARHDGYRQLGITHQRTVSCQGGVWQVIDQVLTAADHLQSKDIHAVRLHWLLPDWEWALEGTSMRLASAHGEVALTVTCAETGLTTDLVRAGKPLVGDPSASPTRGWVSPTYGVKLPALSFAVQARSRLPLTLTTTWRLPD
jgi:hypothetical protein